jgi:hypothetical protein
MIIIYKKLKNKYFYINIIEKEMAHLSLNELLGFLQHEPSKYRTPVIFGEANTKIIESIMAVFSGYQGKIFCVNPYLEVSNSPNSITLQKSQEAIFSFPG